MTSQPESGRVWAARIAVMLVLLGNLSAAIPYLLNPDRHAAAFELSGVAGAGMVRAIGILFLMWNATFPLVILHPGRHRSLFAVVLAQQVIGLAGEIWILASLPAGHAVLLATGLRFVAFDAVGLVLLVIAFVLSRRSMG